jgi:hypothetical protein
MHFIEPESDPGLFLVRPQHFATIIQDPLQQGLDFRKRCAGWIDVFITSVKEMCLARFRMLPEPFISAQDPAVEAFVVIEMDVMDIEFVSRRGSAQG